MTQILYTPDADAAEVVKRPLAQLTPVVLTVAADGFALVGADLTGATVEASTDDFATTVYTNNVGSVTGNLLVTGINVQSATWRVTGSGKLGLLLPGKVIDVASPIYPFRWHPDTIADDRTTLGGAQYSRIRRTQRRATWSFEVIDSAEVDRWRAWYDATDGFRRPFVITEPVTDEPYLVKAPGQWPLTRENFSLRQGELEMTEVPVR